MQAKLSSKLHFTLNIGERLIANRYYKGKDSKNFEKEVIKALEWLRGEVNGAYLRGQCKRHVTSVSAQQGPQAAAYPRSRTHWARLPLILQARLPRANKENLAGKRAGSRELTQTESFCGPAAESA
jgi:hypothetical protein